MPENESNQAPEKKKKGFLWIIIIVLIVVLAAVIGGYALSYMPVPAWLSGVLPSHEVSVPVQTPAVETLASTPEPVKTSPTPSASPTPTSLPEASAVPTASAAPTMSEAAAPAVTAMPYIGADAAADAALKHSKATAKEADFSSVILTERNGMMLYLVEFTAGDYLYEYQVEALTARIESWRKTSNKTADAIAASAETKAAVSSPAPTEQAEPSPTVLIGEEEAKKLAMAHANIQESELVSIKCKVELEGLNLIYDVEMKTKLQEYDYEIDALTGEIVGFDIEKR